MNAEQLREMKDELDTLNVNTRETMERYAYQLIAHGKSETAGSLLVFERVAGQHFGRILHWCTAALAMAEPAPAARRGRPATAKPSTAKPAAAKPAVAKPAAAPVPDAVGPHRHKFDAAGICSVCGAARLRAAKGSAAERPSAEVRTARLPLGDDRPDDFDGGTFGSSSATDRQR